MNIKAQTVLKMAEKANELCFFDLESSNLRGDYGTVLCAVILPYKGKPKIFQVTKPGDDSKIINEIARELEKYTIWCSYYGRGFDQKFIDTRLVANGFQPLEKRHHLDLWNVNKKRLCMSRRSQLQLLALLGTTTQKMGVDPQVWGEVSAHPEQHMPTLVKRCVSDCKGLRDAYDRIKGLVENITK